MKKIDSDFKYVIWIFGGIAIAFPIALILPFSLPFIISAGLLYFGLKQLISYKGLQNWEKTEGSLLQTEIGLLEQLDEYSRGGKNQYFVPLTYFSYLWKGKEYKSNKYAFDNKSIWSPNTEDIAKTIKELESSNKLEVFVNPQSPSEAVLNTEVSKNRYSHSYALVFSGILAAILGLTLLLTKS